MILKYKYIHKQKLLVDYIKGEIDFDLLIKFHKQERDFAKENEVKKVLSDISKIKFDFKAKDIPAYIKELKKTSVENDVKWAIISTATIPTALSYILKEVPLFKNRVSVFSTLEAATVYLGIEFISDDFNTNDFIHVNPTQ